MSKRKEPPEITQDQNEKVHPQITRIKHSDLMSEATALNVTVPVNGEFDEDFFEALKSVTSGGHGRLNCWADIKAMVGFDALEQAEAYRPNYIGHHGPVQRGERFSKEAFEHKAYKALKIALEALDGLTDDKKAKVLNSVAPRFVQAGMALAEANSREEFYNDVEVRRRVRSRLRDQSKKLADENERETTAVLLAMANYIKLGENVSTAARLTFKDDRRGTSESANRQLFYRRRRKK